MPQTTPITKLRQANLFDQTPPPRRLHRPSWHRTSPLSREALKTAAPRQGTRQAQILEVVRQRGRRGATRDELAVETGVPLQSLCGLVRQLLDRGSLLETAETRPTRTGKPAAILVERGIWNA